MPTPYQESAFLYIKPGLPPAPDHSYLPTTFYLDCLFKEVKIKGPLFSPQFWIEHLHCNLAWIESITAADITGLLYLIAKYFVIDPKRTVRTAELNSSAKFNLDLFPLLYGLGFKRILLHQDSIEDIELAQLLWTKAQHYGLESFINLDATASLTADSLSQQKPLLGLGLGSISIIHGQKFRNTDCLKTYCQQFIPD